MTKGFTWQNWGSEIPTQKTTLPSDDRRPTSDVRRPTTHSYSIYRSLPYPFLTFNPASRADFGNPPLIFPEQERSKAARFMHQNMSVVYSLWGGLVLFLAAQPLWNLFFSYPAGFERMLRRGRSWVYVPLRWKGMRKVQILFVSRLIIIGIAITGTVLLMHYSGKRQAWWLIGFFVVSYAVAVWLQGVWNGFRYRQQEDAYYLLHDEMRAKFEEENKDYNESQIRSLSAYQHQQRLRKADEEGTFLAVLRAEASRFRKVRTSTPLQNAEA
jgi:hypothetical protein